MQKISNIYFCVTTELFLCSPLLKYFQKHFRMTLHYFSDQKIINYFQNKPKRRFLTFTNGKVAYI